MAYEITTNGFFTAMHEDCSPEMVRLLNRVELDGEFTPSSKDKALVSMALSKGFIRVI